jgi:type IV secretory pathway TraG/TraD family ATPase VirD4
MGVFRILAVIERTRSSDIRFENMRGRWVPGTAARRGHWRSSTVYLSVKVDRAEVYGPVTGLFIQALSEWLVANPPNPLREVTEYYEAKDELDALSFEAEVLRREVVRATEAGLEGRFVLEAQREQVLARAAAQRAIVADRKKGLVLGPSGEPLGPCKFLFVVDEFPVLPTLQCLMKGPDVGRGQGIGYLEICQSLGQIDERYGQSGTERFLDGAAVLGILPVNNDRTAERLAKRIGRQTIIKTSGSRSLGGGFKDLGRSNQSESLEGVDFVSASDLMSMRQVFGKNKYIVSVQDSGNRPILVDSADWYRQPELRALVHPRAAAKAGAAAGTGFLPAPAMPDQAVARRIWDMGIRRKSKYSAAQFASLAMEQQFAIEEATARMGDS